MRAFAPFLLLAACGGGAASPAPKLAEADSSRAESLGITGGIDSIAVPSGMRLGPPLAMRLLEPGQPVKLDGLLREWQLLSAAKVKSDSPPSGQSLLTALQYDDSKIYLAADVDDGAFDRTAKFSEDEDHVSLFMAFPSRVGGAKSSFVAYEIGFYAGKPGESAGAVKWLSGPKKGSNVVGAKIVEAPKDGGYTFEAVLPWAAFGEHGKTRLGLRGAVRLFDPTGTVSTGNGSASDVKSLPQLLTEPEVGLVEGFLQQKGLSEDAPSFDVLADVAGDSEKERVAVYGSFVTVVGHHYRGGKEFFFRDVGSEIRALEARPVASKGGAKAHDDLVLTRRMKHPNGIVEVLEVWAWNGDQPETLFAQEVSLSQGEKLITNVVSVKPGSIDVSIGEVRGYDASSYKPVLLALISPLLTPWGSVKSRTLTLQDNRFVPASEVAQAAAPGAAPTGPTATPTAPRAAAPSVTVKSSSTLAAELLAQFKKENGIGAGDKPRINLETNLAEDSRAERAVLFGRDLAVFGPGFRGGKGYVFAKLEAFAKDDDVGEITAKDLTGDGRAELVIRGIRRQGAGADAVASDLLLVYSATPEGMKRLFAIETARERGGKRVQGLVQFVPASQGGGFEIDVRSGAAKGFSAKDYPWKEDEPGGSIEPLLLPWGSKKALRYRFDGSKFSLAS